MAGVAQKPITAEQFFRFPALPDGSRQELIRGEVEIMPPPGFKHGAIQVRAAGLLDQHVRPARLGRVTVESGLVTGRDPDTVRGPDVAFWSVLTLPLDQTPDGYPELPADLCLEIVSPNDLHHDVLAKVLEYLDRGVKMVWVIDPEGRTITVYRSRDNVRILNESAAISGEEVLPGFRCRVADFFA